MIRRLSSMFALYYNMLLLCPSATQAYLSGVQQQRYRKLPAIIRTTSSWATLSNNFGVSDDDSTEDVDDLTKLWNMEEEDELLPGALDVRSQLLEHQQLEEQVEATPPAVAQREASNKRSETVSESSSTEDFGDLTNLWSMEYDDEDDEDEDLPPEAMDEAQRRALLERQKVEQQVNAASPPSLVVDPKASTQSQAVLDSIENFEDLTDLWDMEEEDDEDEEEEKNVLLPGVIAETQPPAAQNHDDRVGTVPSKVEPVVSKTSQAVTDSKKDQVEDLSSLWNMEGDDDDDHEGWPDATDEKQRMKLLARQKRAEEVAAPKPSKRAQQPRRRRVVRRSPEFWDLRLRLIREYKAGHGHIDVPYRYEVKIEDEDKEEETSIVKLGYFLYWLRSLFDGEHLQATAPFEFVKELTDLGMKWRFLGKGRRPQLFLQRLNEWRDATREGATMDPTLRTWMWRQRYQYARQCEGLPSTLDNARVDALVDARIIPFQRPMQAMQDTWDKEWQKNFEQWKTKANNNEEEADSSNTLMLWEWEQWCMYDILRGEIPYKGDLPVLLTGFRALSLQNVDFFESPRPVTILLPPDVEATSDVSVDWKGVVEAIRQYFFSHGDFDIKPTCKTCVGDESLYGISARLQREYKWIQSGRNDSEKTTILDDDRITVLENLNFFHSNENGSDELIQVEFEWWARYHDFKRGRRDFLIGNLHAGNINIAVWMEEQQQRFKRLLINNYEGGDGIKESHYEALTNLGVVFHFPLSTKLTGQTALGNVVGRPPSVVKLNEDILPAGGSTLPRKQAEVLEDLAWKLRYDELRAFADLKGHSFVPQSVKPRLSLWANNQRLQYQKYIRDGVVDRPTTKTTTPLNEQRIALLKEIGFDYGIDHLNDGEDGWEAMVAALQRFKAMHGHCFAPVSLPSNPQLGDWVNQQLQSYRCKELSRSKIRELEGIGLDLDTSEAEYFQHSFDALWDERRDELEQFQEERGHCWPDGASPSLTTWTEEQRQLYRLAQEHNVPSYLTQERIEQLEELGFEWE